MHKLYVLGKISAKIWWKSGNQFFFCRFSFFTFQSIINIMYLDVYSKNSQKSTRPISQSVCFYTMLYCFSPDFYLVLFCWYWTPEHRKKTIYQAIKKIYNRYMVHIRMCVHFHPHIKCTLIVIYGKLKYVLSSSIHIYAVIHTSAIQYI